MDNLQLTQEELTQLLSEIKEDCISAINERNADNEYSNQEKKMHQYHWMGVNIGAELLCKKILLTIKYKNLAVSE
jgi:hypothetical protein